MLILVLLFCGVLGFCKELNTLIACQTFAVSELANMYKKNANMYADSGHKIIFHIWEWLFLYVLESNTCYSYGRLLIKEVQIKTPDSS